MTKKEAATILAILKAAYPNSYKGMTQEEAMGTVSVFKALNRSHMIFQHIFFDCNIVKHSVSVRRCSAVIKHKTDVTCCYTVPVCESIKKTLPFSIGIILFKIRARRRPQIVYITHAFIGADVEANLVGNIGRQSL